jgi:uncharacterized DUF497 family protein
MIIFQWDENNRSKLLKHRVTEEEAESVFYADDKIIGSSYAGKDGELRQFCIGTSVFDKLRIVIFTLRHDEYRIISCRHVNKKEARAYEEARKG